MRFRILAAVVAACALALAGCGHHASPSHRTSGPASRCQPSDYAMGCALTAPSKLGLAVTPPVALGIDFAWSCVNPVPANWGHSNYAFGASYLSTDPSKNWSRSCVNLWHSLGAATVAVWETSAARALDGFAAGQVDARRAAAQAAALGMPPSRPIFFAIDFDETPAQASAVASYFRGVASVLGVSRTGAYGGYWAVKRLFDAELVRYGWQTYAWSGGLWDTRAKLEQYLNGSAVDFDRAIAVDYGQWPYTPPKPKPHPAVLPVCVHHRMSASSCAAAKARIASDNRAAAASWRAWHRLNCPRYLRRRNGHWVGVGPYGRLGCGRMAQHGHFFAAKARTLEAQS